MCYSDLSIYEPVAGPDPHTFRQLPRPAGLNFDNCRDVVYSRKAGRYFMNTRRQFSWLAADLSRGDSLFNSKSDQNEVVILGEDSSRNAIIFASGKRIMCHSYGSNTTKELATLPEQILDGHINLINFYLLCASGLYVRHAEGKLERLVVTENAHSLRKTGENQWVIGPDHGLFLFNSANKHLEVLIEGVEFNRRALHTEGNRLSAGSIDGLYTIEINQLVNLADKTSAYIHARQSADHSWWLITMLMSVLILGSAILLIRNRRRIKTLQDEISNNSDLPFTKDDVIMYISEHLPTVSLKPINTHFETNSTQVYTILDPEKPGALIQQLRLDKVMEMRKGGSRAREISLITGLCETYIRKIWNKD